MKDGAVGGAAFVPASGLVGVDPDGVEALRERELQVLARGRVAGNPAELDQAEGKRIRAGLRPCRQGEERREQEPSGDRRALGAACSFVALVRKNACASFSSLADMLLLATPPIAGASPSAWFHKYARRSSPFKGRRRGRAARWR